MEQTRWAETSGGVLVVRGPDAHDFLARVGTQDTKHLVPGQGALNAFLDKRGRVQALGHHVVEDGNTTLLVLRGQKASEVAAFLDGFLFMEAVELEAHDEVPMFVHVDAGSGLAPFAPRVENPLQGAVRTFDGADESGQPVPLLLSFGRSLPAHAPDAAWVDAAEMAAGVPHAPSEINDGVGPLELGLAGAVSWTKGCYTGQEVVSRIESKDRLPKQLMGLCGGDLAAGADVRLDDETVGTVTRSGVKPFAGAIAALAVIKTAAVRRVQQGDGTLVVGEQTVTLRERPAAQPFDLSR